MRHLALVAVLLLVGCSGADDVFDIVFDSCEPLLVVLPADVTAAERASTLAAMAMWNELAAARLSLAEPEEPRLPITFQQASSLYFGVYDDERGEIFVNRGIVDAHARAVVIAHEVGHAFGLRHVEPDARTSAMNPGNLTREPDGGDLAALRALWGECGATGP